MTEPLFKEFNPVSAKQWKQKIQFDLKGADYNDTLTWKSNEGITVKPYYHSDDFETLPEVSNTQATQWRISQTIFVANVEKSNLKAIDSIKRGAESIKFIIPKQEVSIKDLLQNIDTKITTLHFELQFISEVYVENMFSITSAKNTYIHSDIIGNLAKTGNWFNTLNNDFSVYKKQYQITKSITINTSLYQNAGANMVQQFAYSLSHANA